MTRPKPPRTPAGGVVEIDAASEMEWEQDQDTSLVADSELNELVKRTSQADGDAPPKPAVARTTTATRSPATSPRRPTSAAVTIPEKRPPTDRPVAPSGLSTRNMTPDAPKPKVAQPRKPVAIPSVKPAPAPSEVDDDVATVVATSSTIAETAAPPAPAKPPPPAAKPPPPRMPAFALKPAVPPTPVAPPQRTVSRPPVVPPQPTAAVEPSPPPIAAGPETLPANASSSASSVLANGSQAGAPAQPAAAEPEEPRVQPPLPAIAGPPPRTDASTPRVQTIDEPSLARDDNAPRAAGIPKRWLGIGAIGLLLAIGVVVIATRGGDSSSRRQTAQEPPPAVKPPPPAPQPPPEHVDEPATAGSAAVAIAKHPVPAHAPIAAPRTLGGKKVVVEYDKKETAPAPVPAGSAIDLARSSYLAGNQRLFTGDAAGAIVKYKEALAAYPGYVGGYRGLGLAYAQQGDTKDALQAFQTYATAAPTAKDITLIRQRIAHLQHH